MSTATELAAIEAATAEAELTEDESAMVRDLVQDGSATLEEAVAAALATREPDDDGDQGQPTDPPQGEPTAEQLRKLDREHDRHLKAMRTIMGPFVAGFEECRECSGHGLVPPGPKPQHHEFFHVCETCEGYGQVLTGSLRDGNTERDCPACGGRGYVEALGPLGVPLAEVPLAQQEAQVQPTAVQPSETPAPAAAPATGVTFGRPAWMGDPAVGPNG